MAGDDIGISENQVQWHVLSDSLYKLDTWTLDEFCSTNRAPYDYEALVNQQFTHKNHLQNGFPRHVPNEDSNKIDNFRYVDIDIDDIENNVGSIPFFFFFLVLETGSTGIKNGALHYSVYDDNSHPDYFQYLPTGYHPEDEPVNYTVAQLILKTEYDVVMTPGAYNYGGFVSKVPQIIDSWTKASPEDYYQ